MALYTVEFECAIMINLIKQDSPRASYSVGSLCVCMYAYEGSIMCISLVHRPLSTKPCAQRLYMGLFIPLCKKIYMYG